MDMQWMSEGVDVTRAMDITKAMDVVRVMGVTKAMDVTRAMDIAEQWMSKGNGCHKAMDPRKQWMSRTKTSFSHLQLSLFEGRLSRQLRFHIFNCQILREARAKG